MADNGIPEELKAIKVFLERAKELQQRDPIVSYYAKYCALKTAIEAKPTTQESNAFLMNLMSKVEEEKKQLAQFEEISNDLVGYAHVQNFAMKIFLNADNEDRAGNASLKTAKTFLAASILLQILKSFGEIEEEVAQKIKYAKFKAADIMKCLKEGRQPTPGPPGGDPSMQPQPSSSSQNQDLSQQLPPPPPQMPSAPPADPFTQQSLVRDAGSAPLPYLQPSGQASHFVYDAPSAPSTLPPPSTELDQQSTFTLPPPKNASSPAASHPPPSYSSTSATTTVSSRKNAALDSLSASSPAPISFSKTSNTTSAAAHSNEEEHEIDPFSIDHTAVVDAQKEARHAISALQYDDVKTAVAKLRNALALLEPLTKK